MAAKCKTLPKDIDELLKAGDLEEIKRKFSQCEPNALHINKFGSNVFSRTPLHREFALALEEARAAGVEVLFLCCRVEPDEIKVINE